MVKKQREMGSFLSKEEPAKEKTKNEQIMDPKTMPNYRFYMNEIESKPNGAKIDTIHKQWGNDFEKFCLQRYCKSIKNNLGVSLRVRLFVPIFCKRQAKGFPLQSLTQIFNQCIFIFAYEVYASNVKV